MSDWTKQIGQRIQIKRQKILGIWFTVKKTKNSDPDPILLSITKRPRCRMLRLNFYGANRLKLMEE